MAEQTLTEVLQSLTAEGELYEQQPDRAVRCYACGHRCLIKENRHGICYVRYNDGGRLRVPWGYVAALQCDPTEKKPFFHILPGSNTLTFGMLGCDYHCGYCFTGDTVVITDRGPLALAEAFAAAERVQRRPDAEIAYPANLRAVAASGTLRPVRAVFKHAYRGRLATIQPYCLPPLRCTPDHRVYATADPAEAPQLMRAEQLTTGHFLAIPRRQAFSSPQVVDVARELSGFGTAYRVRRDPSGADRETIVAATARGETSRQIGAALGKRAAYLRHVRSKPARLERADGRADERSAAALLEEGAIRFPHAHRPGLPLALPLDERLARLLGYYCAAGSVVASRRRPNSQVLNFGFAPDEQALCDEVGELLASTLGLRGRRVRRTTTEAVAVSRASAALLFKALAGAHAAEKRVPQALFDAPRPVVEAFLAGYVAGDGHRYPSGKISVTTISRALAYGVAWLALKLGHLPSVDVSAMPAAGRIQGRLVRRAPEQYRVVWYEGAGPARRVVETDDHYLVPLRAVHFSDYDGDVYNLEVDEEHNYLAGFFLVSNCQNWLTSQTLRDQAAGVPPQLCTPAQLAQIAKRQGAKLVASSYNEPLITSEWARAIFSAARAEGLRCCYVSNGNATPEVIDYIKPDLVGYKVDLKTMNDRNYRKLGGVLTNVLEGIRLVHAAGLWLEIVTLLVPGFNDDPGELRAAAEFLAGLSRDIPWHVTAFHQDYKMVDPDNTTARDLMCAAEIGAAAGLRYVYCGNLPGQVERFENTYCPECQELLIARFGYRILLDKLSGAGRCPRCQTAIPGIWI